MESKQTPDWLDKNEYPFTSKFIEIDGYQMHYVDEGQGQILLMVHGIPDWSFSYRHLIKDLSKKYRCIVPDNLGYGLSDKPDEADYSHPAHAKRLEKFIEKMELQNVNLVLHDFSGPMGIFYAENHPENVNKIIVSNTWMWSLAGDKHFQSGIKLLNSWLGKFLYLNMNFSVTFMMKNAYADKSKLTKAIHQQFKKPINNIARKANYTLGKELGNASVWHDSLYQNSHKIADNDILILWAMKDKFFPAENMLPKWQAAFPKAQVVKLENSGHFFQEEAPQEAIQAIREFVR